MVLVAPKLEKGAVYAFQSAVNQKFLNWDIGGTTGGGNLKIHTWDWANVNWQKWRAVEVTAGSADPWFLSCCHTDSAGHNNLAVVDGAGLVQSGVAQGVGYQGNWQDQQWYLDPVPGYEANACLIRSLSSGKALSVQGNLNCRVVNVDVNDVNQRWFLHKQ